MLRYAVENKKAVALVLAVSAAVLAGGLYLQRRSEPPPEPEAAAPELAPAPPVPAPAPAPAPRPALPPAAAAGLPKLEDSDELLRARAKALSPLPKAAAWLKGEDLVRRFTAAIDTMADGASPRDGLEFLAPKKKFSAKKVGDKHFVDPRSYARYSMLAGVVDSVDARAAAKLVKDLEPLFQQSMSELGDEKREFRATLLKAIDELLRTPVVQGDIPLEEKVLSYHILPFGDEDLQLLSIAQKHLLRTGPKNTTVIQRKLRELALGLGASAQDLPKARNVTAPPISQD